MHRRSKSKLDHNVPTRDVLILVELINALREPHAPKALTRTWGLLIRAARRGRPQALFTRCNQHLQLVTPNIRPDGTADFSREVVAAVVAPDGSFTHLDPMVAEWMGERSVLDPTQFDGRFASIVFEVQRSGGFDWQSLHDCTECGTVFYRADKRYFYCSDECKLARTETKQHANWVAKFYGAAQRFIESHQKPQILTRDDVIKHLRREYGDDVDIDQFDIANREWPFFKRIGGSKDGTPTRKG